MYNNLPKFLLLGVMFFVAVFFSQQSLGDFSPADKTAFSEPGKVFNTEDNQLLAAAADAVSKRTPASEEAKPEILEFKRVGDERAPETGSRAVLVADLETGKTFFELNPKMRWPLASLTKLVSAVIAKDFSEEEKKVTVIPEDFDLETNNYVLEAGGEYKVKDLLWAMLLNSSNEAAVALARSHGYDDFIEAMNVKAERWGLENTNFDDPNGLSVSNQSTARDLKKIVYAIYKSYPEIFEMTRRAGWTIYDSGHDKFLKVITTNDFAGRNDFLGGKTGYTDEALGNLVSIFSYQDRPILIIVLGTNDRFGDTKLLYDWFRSNFSI